MARQYATALMCAIEAETGLRPELLGRGMTPSRTMQTKVDPTRRAWAALAIKHSSAGLVASYPSHKLMIASKGHAYLPDVYKAAPKPALAILAGGGASELGQHWYVLHFEGISPHAFGAPCVLYVAEQYCMRSLSGTT